MNISDLLFPQRIYGVNLADDNSIRGGIQYPQNFIFGDVIRVIASDYFQYISPDQEAIAPVMTFQNGYTIKIYMKIIYQTGRYDLHFTLQWYDENDEFVSGIHSSAAMLPSLDSIMQFEFMFVFYTKYPADPIAGLTPADKIYFGILFFDQIPRGYNSPLINYGIQTTLGAIQSEARATLGTNYARLLDIAYLSYDSTEELAEWLHGRGLPFTDPVFPEEPPAGGDDTSGTGGGDGDYSGEGQGNYDNTSDPIDFPALPTGGALTCGMIKGFVMAGTQIVAMQNTLWNMNIFDIATQFQKLVNEPLQCLISLHAMPVLPDTGQQENVKLGSFDTQATGLRITNQYKVVDCGTIQIKRNWGNALDYAPYTKICIYLPFIGFRDIQIEDAQNTTIHIKYYVDVLTGACTAFVKCGISVLYTFSGNCIQHIPVTSQSSDLLKANITAIGTTAVGVATGNPAAAVAGAAFGAVNTATAKNHVSRTGDLAGAAGMLGDFEPYVVMHRPVQSLAKNYNRFKGYPSNITERLGSLTGYTEVEHIHLANITGATDAELKEIETLLKQGVII